jgi:hypothetical protein
VGNFPQAFSHVPLIDTARTLSVDEGPKYPRQRERAATPVPGGQEEEEASVAWGSPSVGSSRGKICRRVP